MYIFKVWCYTNVVQNVLKLELWWTQKL